MFFGLGLNVIHGASDTGKSFLLESIDFMLGSNKQLRDIPERVGYDTILMGLEDNEGQQFTLLRATAGGAFRYYDGLHLVQPEEVEARPLSQKHNPTNQDNVSMLLLSKIGLDGKRVRRNAKGESNSLSMRNLAHLCLISETEIQKEGSPIETGQNTTRTAENSIFKLLLTGVDDSAIEPEEEKKTKRVSRSAKIEVIDELIAENQDRITSLVGDDNDPNELEGQLGKLDDSIEQEKRALSQTEEEYRSAVSARNALRRSLEEARERRAEIAELIERFTLLDNHYQSDLSRLAGIRESGVLISVLDAQSCPLCGAKADKHDLESDCDGNVDAVIEAADAEWAKIDQLRKELSDTVEKLNSEATQHESLIPELESNLAESVEALSEVNPDLSSKRAAYSELLEKRSSVEQALRVLSTIAELEERREELEATPDTKVSDSEKVEEPSSELSQSTLNSFSKVYEQLLESWNFPEGNRVHYDQTTRDFVISGKPRGARGKGLRALSYAGFVLSLMEYTRRNGLPHPGFVVLDTPLLAYREPDGDEDDLSGTNVHELFYRQLRTITDRQVIILENVDPPEDAIDPRQNTLFSKNPQVARYGLFPLA